MNARFPFRPRLQHEDGGDDVDGSEGEGDDVDESEGDDDGDK